MCGRVRCTLHVHQVARACGLTSGDDASSLPARQMDRYRPSYNVSPGACLPVVRKAAVGEEAAPAIHCMKWGLVPSFTKKTDKPDHYKMFNARSESIKEKTSFRRLLPTNRCLVAVEGFYEWKKDGSKKQPYYIHFEDQRPLVFAALYDSWSNSEDRMPVILGNKDSIDIWLNSCAMNFEAVLRPYEGPDLVWYPVTPAVGKRSFDCPECIKEIQLKPTGDKLISMFFTLKPAAADQSEKGGTQKPSSELSQTHYSTCSVKGEHLSNEYEEPKKDEKTVQSDDFASPKMETGQQEICGIKREFEEITADYKPKVENISSWPCSPAKKKERTTKNAGERQASLLSYFGKK
ncbi:uncharacterized protein LOC109723198 isoform X2 [Ananas comosus]|uniref:Uncharacterized protein LOC109723198 isoform X2 n=1 Tax=Ananas comosus TaxID=4615 RepID=A0A6P5GEN7_ANACO|nr:uncharacterized protein LOC109723198 isoform X2 [Ananas comosus]